MTLSLFQKSVLYYVLISSQYTGELEQKAAETGGQLIYRSCDVTNADDVNELFAAFIPTLKSPIRGLVACVGVSDTGPAIDYPADKFLRIVEINIMGTYIVAQATARAMHKEQVDGAMVLIASMSGWVANKVITSFKYSSTVIF